MTEDEFYKLVAEMRAEQKKFFSTRDSQALEKSKKLEKLVDKAIFEHQENKLIGNLF